MKMTYEDQWAAIKIQKASFQKAHVGIFFGGHTVAYLWRKNGSGMYSNSGHRIESFPEMLSK